MLARMERQKIERAERLRPQAGIRGHAIAVGWRVDRKDPWRRRFLSRGYNLLARTFLGTGVRDVDCALKVFRREALAPRVHHAVLA